jgi:hypothetical protein
MPGCTLPAARSSTATSTPDGPPILSVRDRHVSVRVTVPDSARVTPEDLDTARRLAGAVATYIAELEARMAAQDRAADEGEAA